MSTDEQNPDAQRDALIRAGVDETNLDVDRTSGAKSSRSQWDVVNKVLRARDVLVCTRLDRLGRSTAHLVSLLDEFRQREVEFRFLKQGIDPTIAEGRMVYRMLVAVAEFQRDLIVANTHERLAAASVRGRTGGRRQKLTAHQAELAQQHRLWLPRPQFLHPVTECTTMLIARSIALFLLAALCEIGGAWLVWQGVREHRGWLWIGAGVIALGAYGFVATLQPDPHFGRILAAYGGVFVAGSLAWGMALDGYWPDRYDIIGALICLAGVAVIMYAPRSH